MGTPSQALPSCPHTPRHHSPQSARQPEDRLPTQLCSRSGLWTRVPAMLQKEHFRGHERRSPPPDAPPRCPEAQLPEEALHSGPAHRTHSSTCAYTHTHTCIHTHTRTHMDTRTPSAPRRQGAGHPRPVNTACVHVHSCSLPPPPRGPARVVGDVGPGWARPRGPWGTWAPAGRGPGSVGARGLPGSSPRRGCGAHRPAARCTGAPAGRAPRPSGTARCRGRSCSCLRGPTEHSGRKQRPPWAPSSLHRRLDSGAEAAPGPKQPGQGPRCPAALTLQSASTSAPLTRPGCWVPSVSSGPHALKCG